MGPLRKPLLHTHTPNPRVDVGPVFGALHLFQWETVNGLNSLHQAVGIDPSPPLNYCHEEENDNCQDHFVYLTKTQTMTAMDADTPALL